MNQAKLTSSKPILGAMAMGLGLAVSSQARGINYNQRTWRLKGEPAPRPKQVPPQNLPNYTKRTWKLKGE